MVASDARPLVVCEANGAPIDVVLENDKGFKKSLESGSLWSIHPETGRLLPYAEGVAAAIEDRGTWYRATLTGATTASSTSGPRAPDTEPAPATVAPAGDQMGAVLTSLVDVIRDRRREMPEGSYTTHLFAAGNEKIRKKTGEEAVELILAGNRAELTSEAADLIYHLLVLLEVEEISLDEVAAELTRRS
ncbi:MAG: phosphoribosyl-ATP diphosphatase [Spirochaetales bacterium]|nr:phosphoribosyl-ATP diphosphatase [Spirochaetales bacterium]